jgi:hypothetical protein
MPWCSRRAASNIIEHPKGSCLYTLCDRLKHEAEYFNARPSADSNNCHMATLKSVDLQTHLGSEISSVNANRFESPMTSFATLKHSVESV